MTEEAKRNSTASDNYFDYVMKIMKENEEFLRRKAEGDYGEVIDLINDAIDLLGSAVEREENREDYVKRPMVFYLHHVLMPSSYAIQTNLLAGNLPACFMQLRLMLESLAKCYLADLKYPDQVSFQEKLKWLEEESAKNKISTSKLMKELGKEIGLKNGFVALWSKLSNDWIHAEGFVKRIVSQTENSTIPSWALIIPTRYMDDDLDAIEELKGCTSRFRGLLKATIASYKQEVGSEGVYGHA